MVKKERKPEDLTEEFGQAINTAVDAAEITRHRFMKNLSIGKITIGTEEMPPREGDNRARMVSTIEITLTHAPPVKKEVGEGSEKTASAIPIQPTELTSIEGIGANRAEKLKSCGVNSVQDLANFDPKELSEKLQISEKRVSKWIDEAKKERVKCEKEYRGGEVDLVEDIVRMLISDFLSIWL